MKIAGFQMQSFVDYPGKLAAVVFTPGCNLDCFYCHNRHVLDEAVPESHTADEVLAKLDERRGFLDAVVITGGEPTLQRGLDDFIRAVRAMGYLVKLDTNGTRPRVLKALLDEGLLDYVAMDVKAPAERYEEICGAPVNVKSIEASIALLIDGPVPYEFRTTVAPQLTERDIVAIARWIHGARRFVLQQFRRPAEYGTFSDLRNAAAPHPAYWPHQVAAELQLLVKSCDTRGFDPLPLEAAVDGTTEARLIG
jgi:pyruvate formate lyase activating enzyme